MKKIFAIVLVALSLVLPTGVFDVAAGMVLPPVRLDREISIQLTNRDFSGAIEGLGKAMAGPDSDPGLRFYMAYSYRELGFAAYQGRDFFEAVALFAKGLTYVDDDPDLLLGLGLSSLMYSDYGGAETAFRRLVDLDPQHLPALQKLGEIYYLTNYLEEAFFFWSRALELAPDNISLQRRLGNLQRQMQVGRHFETEADEVFAVSFDGNKNPAFRSMVMQILADAYYEIGPQLNIYPVRQIGVMLLEQQAFLEMTDSPGWAGGAYEGQIKVPVAGGKPETLRSILYHEYVHALIYDMMANRCPWWLNEGLAQYFSPDPAKAAKLALAGKIVAAGAAPQLAALPAGDRHDPEQARQSYALALSAVNALVRMFNPYNLQRILEIMGTGRDFNEALYEATGYTMAEFQAAWIAGF